MLLGVRRACVGELLQSLVSSVKAVRIAVGNIVMHQCRNLHPADCAGVRLVLRDDEVVLAALVDHWAHSMVQ